MNGVIQTSVREIKDYPEDLFNMKKNKEFLNYVKKTVKEINTLSTDISPYFSSNILFNKLVKEYDMYYFNGEKVTEENKDHLVTGFQTFFTLKKKPNDFVKSLSISVLATKRFNSYISSW